MNLGKVTKALAIFISAIVIIIFLQGDILIHAKTDANKSIDKVYKNILTKLAWKENATVKYKMIDITGDGIHELIMLYWTDDSGIKNENMIVYTYKKNKAKKIINYAGYNISNICFYPETKSFILSQNDHGAFQSYFKKKNGLYIEVARTGGEDWRYYCLITNDKTDYVSETAFNKKTKALKKGNKYEMDCYKEFSSYCPVGRLQAGYYSGEFDDSDVENAWLEIIESDSKYKAEIQIERLCIISKLDFSQIKNKIYLTGEDPAGNIIKIKGKKDDQKIKLTIAFTTWIYFEVGDTFVFYI